ncbi:MAG: exodeoxyribonuclease III [Candidatus Saccharibacteria bacterium]|nr:exodeoxyribonuclease III [Candidatus Saccharibacteria bacterium]
MRLFSWNVNGIRAVIKKGALQKFLEEEKPDVLCLQEIKAKPEQVEFEFSGYKVFWNPAERAGYSGTAILVKKEIAREYEVRELEYDFSNREKSGEYDGGSPEYDFLSEKIAKKEGRVLVLDFREFYLVDVYTPNSKPDLARLELREKDWDPEFLRMLKDLEKLKPVVTCGDFNAAHTEIDLARPKTNRKSAGFTDEERRGVDNIISAGFIDTFRSLNPGVQRYTWWSHWGNARANNVGWRIDYFFISKSLKKNLRAAEIYEDIKGSDHCPVSIDLEV